MTRLRAKTVRRPGVTQITLSVEEYEPVEREVSAAELLDATEDDHLFETFSYTYGAVDLETMLAYEAEALNLEELGDAGVDYQGGINRHADEKANYQPFLARGLRTDYGLYHQVFLDEIGISRPFQDIVNALRSGDWYVEAPDDEREGIAEDLERHLFDVQGGWGKFLQDAAYMLLSGFVVFEEVFSPGRVLDDGTVSEPSLDKLAFRYPKQVLEWVMDPSNRDLVAIKMARGQSLGGSDYYLPASAALIINVNAFGNDFEGVSLLRAVVKYHLAKDLFTRLEALAGEKFGVPIFVLSQADNEKASDESETDLFTTIYNQLAAEDMALIELPDGKTFELISPSGVMPSFTELKRYCDEQIALALQGEGNLLGMQGQGSRALAEVADNRSLRAAPAYAQLICEAINGARGTPYQGTLRKLQQLRHGPPSDGQWCKLRFSLDRNGRDSEWFARVGAAKQAGLLGNWTEDDIDQLRAELGLGLRQGPAPTSQGGNTA